MLETPSKPTATRKSNAFRILLPVAHPHQANDRDHRRQRRRKRYSRGDQRLCGRLVAGDARFKPCTPHGVQKLLEAYDIDTEGADAVVVGRSDIVGKPIANLLIQKAPQGNATTTICHSRTDDLAAKTRTADLVIAAAGVTEFIDGSMLKKGATVIDVGINRVDADTEKGYKLVGDVDYESAEAVAGAITPVPGGVGPMTRAMLLYNTVAAASDHHDIEIDLP